MKRVRFLLIAALLPLLLTGCVELLGAAGSGAVVTAEYILSGSVEKTMCFGYGRTKKALLVALSRMEIVADKAIEVEGGEEILARANQMEIKVELREITPCVTRISVRAGDGFLRWDKATAQEILAQTNKIAEDLTGKAG
ncbi:MAG: DUF3568 family protein [Deltaproteobacteria bacterium]|jgi:hypothetical protein|nr:DUF3568 family protein [Deltaproteobacteria bacterium]NTV57053.1 DUF3568 family protein [Deltaproteobacteria bacterium]